MSAEENKAIVRRSYEGILRGDLSVVDELIAPDIAYYFGGSDQPFARGTTAFKQGMRDWLDRWPDQKSRIDEIFADGDTVIVRWTLIATHLKEIQTPAFGHTAPPTGKEVSWTAVAIHRLSGGKIVEPREYIDSMARLRQLGVIPAPGQARAGR